MQKTILFIALMMVSLAAAQLKGSGKTVTKTFDYKNFDKVYFQDIDGKLEVEIGLTWSITITIDDNLESLLNFEENAKETSLIISFKENLNNKKYIEDTNVRIKITMPEASVIGNDSNANLEVKGIVGRYFRLENKSNAITKISGSIDELEVQNRGNGNAFLKDLIASKASVICSGNGNVSVNVTSEITAKVSGNGNVVNFGTANFDTNSSKSGNGNFIKKTK